MMKKIAALVLFPLLISEPLLANSLRVGVEDDSPPKWIINPQKPIDGFCPDLFNLLAKKDPTLTFQYPHGAQPQKRIEKEIDEKQLDLLCALTRNAEREARYQYIDAALYNMDYVLVARADDPVAPQSWADVRALGNKGIILLNYDSSAIKRLNDLGGLSLDTTGQTIEINLKKLSNHRGRFFYYPSAGVRAEMRQLGNSHQFRLIYPALETVPFFLIAGKHLPSETLSRLRAAIQTAQQSGELQQIRSKWLN